MKIHIDGLHGINELTKEMNRLTGLDLSGIIQKNATQIYNRGKRKGGTPRRTGELRLSLGYDGDTVGYTKEYAPHVEYGHRKVNGGYVPGQYYLQRNVATQEPIFQRDVARAIRGEK